MAQPNRHLPLSITIAVVVHVAAAVLLVIGYQAKRELAPSPDMVINTVKAKVIDAEELAESQRRRQEALRREELKRQQIAEQKKREQERLKRAEEKRRLQAELEAKQKAERERKKAEAAKRRAELEKKRLAEEARRIAQQKKAAKARKLAEQKKAAEARRLAELKQRREQEQEAIDRQRLASLEQEEAELMAEAQRLERTRKMSRLVAEYRDAIRNKIERNWRKPLDYQANAWCRVLVVQTPGGIVQNVVVEDCTGNDAFRESVENAVWKAEPLPKPPSPELFHRELHFEFRPRA